MTEKGPTIPKSLLARPGMQMLLFVFTLLYIISPVDLIPDVMPIIGWIDDAAVILAEIASFIIYLKKTRQRHTDKTRQQSEDN